MLMKELAKALDISPAMVTKLAKRGMPTDSVERAERWRRRHLSPGMVKGSRYGTSRKPVQTANTAPAVQHGRQTKAKRTGRIDPVRHVMAWAINYEDDPHCSWKPDLLDALAYLPPSRVQELKPELCAGSYAQVLGLLAEQDFEPYADELRAVLREADEEGDSDWIKLPASVWERLGYQIKETADPASTDHQYDDDDIGPDYG